MTMQSLFDDLDGLPDVLRVPAAAPRAAVPQPPTADGPSLSSPADLVKKPTAAVRIQRAQQTATVTRDGDTIAICLAAPSRILSTNMRVGWRAEGKQRSTLRDLMYDIADAHQFPTGWARPRVEVVLQFPRAGKRDNANFQALVAKPLVDALGQPRTYTIRQGKRKGEEVTDKGWGLLLGDDTDHLGCPDCPHIRFGAPVGVKNTALPFGRITVTVTNLAGGATCTGTGAV